MQTSVNCVGPSKCATQRLLVMRLGLAPDMAGIAKMLRTLRSHLMESLNEGSPIKCGDTLNCVRA